MTEAAAVVVCCVTTADLYSKDIIADIIYILYYIYILSRKNIYLKKKNE